MYTTESLEQILATAVTGKCGREVVYSREAELFNAHFIGLTTKRTPTPEDRLEADFLRPFYNRMMEL